MESIFNSLKEQTEQLCIQFYPPVSNEQIVDFEKKYISIPSAYKDFITISNGLTVTEHYDCMIYSLQDVVDVTESTIEMNDSDIDKGLLHIGTFWEDAVYINQKNEIFLSFQGIDTPVSANLHFRQFLRKCVQKTSKYFGMSPCRKTTMS